MNRQVWFCLIALCASTRMLGCGDDSEPAPSTGADAGADASAAADSGAKDATTAADATASDGATATRVSKPGEYSGYSDAIYADDWALSSQYVPVSDGTKLAMDLYRPKDKTTGQVVSTKLPVVWMHTPYNRRNFNNGVNTDLAGKNYPGAAAELVKFGYVVAIVDFRGLYASFGHNSAYNRGEWLDKAHLDAYDITEWLAVQPWSNGKIGMWGCSATGGSQLQAATTAPPSLKAIFPMSCEFDAYPFGVPGGMAAAKGTPTSVPPGQQVTQQTRDAIAEPVDGDTDKSQLNQAIAEHANTVETAGYVPYRDSNSDTVTDETVKPWWVKTSPYTYLDKLKGSKIAIYAAANWDEAATKYGAFFTFNNVYATNPAKLIVGPATHCAWFSVKNKTNFDITVEEHRFFDFFLKGIENGVMTEDPVYYYTYNAPAGKEWSSSKKWPLAGEKPTKYYLGDTASLTTTAPTASDKKDEYTVAYDVTADNIATKGLTYATAPLTADLQITGHPVVNLWISSTATDNDVVATLQDVAPDGTAVSYNIHGRLRASLRKVQEAPFNNLGLPWHGFYEADISPLVAGQPVELTFDLLPISMVFKSGHSIRLVVNFAALEASKATPKLDPAPKVTIYRDATHKSSITLPVIEG